MCGWSTRRARGSSLERRRPSADRHVRRHRLLFREQVILRAWFLKSPRWGARRRGHRYIPGLADFVPMVKGTRQSDRRLPGRVGRRREGHRRRARGSKVHNDTSGVATSSSPTTPLHRSGARVALFPQNCEQKPPRHESKDPVDRRDDDLLKVVPENPRQAFDMHKVIFSLVDDRRFFAMKPSGAQTSSPACCVAVSHRHRANNSMFYGGILDVNTSDKALASSTSATPSTSPALSPKRARLQAAPRSSSRHHSPRREDALRGGESAVPKFTVTFAGVWRRLLRDERPRYEPDLAGRLARLEIG